MIALFIGNYRIFCLLLCFILCSSNADNEPNIESFRAEQEKLLRQLRFLSFGNQEIKNQPEFVALKRVIREPPPYAASGGRPSYGSRPPYRNPPPYVGRPLYGNPPPYGHRPPYDYHGSRPPYVHNRFQREMPPTDYGRFSSGYGIHSSPIGGSGIYTGAIGGQGSYSANRSSRPHYSGGR